MTKFIIDKTKGNHVSRLVYDAGIKELLGILQEGGDVPFSLTSYEMVFNAVTDLWVKHNDDTHQSPDVTSSLEKERVESRAAAVIRMCEIVCVMRAVKNDGPGTHRLRIRDGVFNCMFLVEKYDLKLTGEIGGNYLASMSSLILNAESYHSWKRKRAQQGRKVRIKGIEDRLRLGRKEAPTGTSKVRNAERLTLFDIILVAFESPPSRL